MYAFWFAGYGSCFGVGLGVGVVAVVVVVVVLVAVNVHRDSEEFRDGGEREREGGRSRTNKATTARQRGSAKK